MPLQLHAFGAVVADVTAHPNMDVGVVLGTATAEGLCEMVALGFNSEGEGGGGGWLYGLKEPPPCGVRPS